MIDASSWKRSALAGLAAVALSGTVACKKADNQASPQPTKEPVQEAAKETKNAGQTIEMKVTEKGFEPANVAVKKGEPVTLVITRTVERTCATEIVIDDYGINTKLPLNKAVTVSFTPKAAGDIQYGCAMGKMIGGVLKIQ
jgi:plastocyanin domain-containing protein